MNISQIKILAWLFAGVLTLGLSGYVYWFIQRLPEIEAPIDGDAIRAKLEDVPAIAKKVDDLIAYEDVQRLFHETGLNWTGKAAPKPVVIDPGNIVQPKPIAVPVAELVKVLMIKVDPTDPDQSAVFLRYLPKAQVPAAPVIEGYTFNVGDALHAPHDAIHVQAIEVEGVTFGSDEEGREPETLGPEIFDIETMIVRVGPNGVVSMPVERRFQKGAPLRPSSKNTQRISPGRYQLGQDDTDLLGQDYARIMTQEISHRRHRDPNTGRYDGIELTQVRPDGVAARHGAQAGDIIKSINGHPVSSVPEAINFAKNNADKYDKWEIVIERRGREITQTYESP